jgi:hypothetical protein
MAIAPAPKTATTSLRFSVPPAGGVKAFRNINADTDTGVRKTNVTPIDHQVTIENARETGGAKLDVNGFELFHRPTKHQAFNNDEEVEREYYPESIEYLKEVTGASKVVIFDHSKDYLNS